ncbi:pyocin activator PrtN family protein [Mesorhizobium sp.]|nr:pyocin activator PrtN family protein [Mesorhizobium sp.]
MSLNTAFLLMAEYNDKAIIPLDEVRRDPLANF